MSHIRAIMVEIPSELHLPPPSIAVENNPDFFRTCSISKNTFDFTVFVVGESDDIDDQPGELIGEPGEDWNCKYDFALANLQDLVEVDGWLVEVDSWLVEDM